MPVALQWPCSGPLGPLLGPRAQRDACWSGRRAPPRPAVGPNGAGGVASGRLSCSVQHCTFPPRRRPASTGWSASPRCARRGVVVSNPRGLAAGLSGLHPECPRHSPFHATGFLFFSVSAGGGGGAGWGASMAIGVTERVLHTASLRPEAPSYRCVILLPPLFQPPPPASWSHSRTHTISLSLFLSSRGDTLRP